ncbi:MAG: NAD(P)/FAD-dependent oxidoreductase [candidate division WOR-3 bacterium]
MTKSQIIIIGGGASGLMAAISAARRDKQVLLIEKNNQLGRKILFTGNGRCNLTNINLSIDKYYGENTKCLYSIFARFGAYDTIKFFEGLGVKLKVEKDGRVFPNTNKAETVLNALIKEIARLGIKVKLNERVLKISSFQNNWQVKTDKNVYQAKAVILTTGGKSYPQLGSNGDGYKMAQKLGHTIIELKPALVPIELKDDWYQTLQGINMNVKLKIFEDKKVIAQQEGEMIFTHYGISGPLVLDLSRLIDNKKRLVIDFLPHYNQLEDLRVFLKSHPKRTLINTLSLLIPKQVCIKTLQESQIATDKQVSQLTKKEIIKIHEHLHNQLVAIKGLRSFHESMVTAGGVAIDEIKTKTMESKLHKGLYFAGEILDIDGVSGGYNLQFAWSSGYIAGLSEKI